MVTGFRNSAGTDFDDLFDLYEQGTKPSATNYRTSNGVDLAQRYAPLAYGTKGANVNMRTSAGLDLSNLWARKGSAVYSLGFNGSIFSAGNTGLTGQPGTLTASVTLAIRSDGTWAIYKHPQTEVVTGTWLPSGETASAYQVRFTAANIGQADIYNSAPSYASCASDNSISASLSIPAQSSQYLSESVLITCQIRSSDGRSTETSCYFSISVLGWL